MARSVHPSPLPWKLDYYLTKGTFMKCNLILIITALILSVGIMRTYSHQPVSPCMDEPGCVVTSNTGTLQTKTLGYPLAIQETKIFKPIDTSKYAETSLETQGLS